MYAYIEGKITYLSPTNTYIDIQGLGYDVNISLQTYSKIESLTNVKLWIHQHVKEDSLTLYGFFDEDEKHLFRLLISVSGIGPNTGRVILSSMTSQEVRTAIIHENVVAFNKVKGVGPKTAKRIILDLKDKVLKEGLVDEKSTEIPTNTIKIEATSALIALGFQNNKIKKIVDQCYSDEISVENLIKKVLQQVSR